MQGKWKATKLKVPFFRVSNIEKIIFYHTETLLPIELKRTKAIVNQENKVEHVNVVEPLKGLPLYSLFIDLKNSITNENRVCDLSNLKIQEQEEKVSMGEKEFIDFLDRIHNEFYKNSLKGSKKYLGDIILTFIFFKYLEERVQMLGKTEKYEENGIALWSKWLSYEEQSSKTMQYCGQKIYEIIDSELKRLSNTDDETDSNNEYKWGYEREYREFSSVLVGVNNIPKNKSGYEFLYKIYRELNGYNTATNKLEKSLHLHSCNFDVYGAIYEKFKDKNEKAELGQYYTKRHISRILARLTLKPYIDKMIKEIADFRNESEQTGNKIIPEDIVNIIEKHYSNIKILDPSCGTGGLLTECYAYLEEAYKERLNGKHEKIERLLSSKMFYGIDIEDDCIKKAKLNMFFAGDGHTELYRGSSLEPLTGQAIKLSNNCNDNPWNVIVSNPPYGKGKEYKFVEKYIEGLPYGGRIGIIIPNGILENPSKEKFRKMMLTNLKIESIISLNKFVFAPYTKQKTYMIIGYKRAERIINEINNNFIESEGSSIDYSRANVEFDKLNDRIWCYILDYDGYNLSDNRWVTDLIVVDDDGKPQYMHNDTFEVIDKYLEPEIIRVNQLDIDGSLVGKKGDDGNYYLNKACYITLNKDIVADNFYNLLPEFYMRQQEPEYISEEQLIEEIKSVETDIKKLLGLVEEGDTYVK